MVNVKTIAVLNCKQFFNGIVAIFCELKQTRDMKQIQQEQANVQIKLCFNSINLFNS